MEKITAIRGFKDILPEDAQRFQEVEGIARFVFTSFGFREIRIPIMEKTDLFKRSIGEATDIVEKEMYTFRDRDDECLTLRPEATASVIRAYIEHNMSAAEQVTRLFTIDPVSPGTPAERSFSSVQPDRRRAFRRRQPTIRCRNNLHADAFFAKRRAERSAVGNQLAGLQHLSAGIFQSRH